MQKIFVGIITKFWADKGCSGIANNNGCGHQSVSDNTSAPSSKTSDYQENNNCNFNSFLKEIEQNNLTGLILATFT